MSGEQLYAAYCAALWVEWPRPKAYAQMFNSPPRSPVAWPFLGEYHQKGWDHLADALSDGE